METPITLPFVFWNKNSVEPCHKITSIRYHHSAIATGSESGEICIWSLKESVYFAKVICILSKTSPCRALAFVQGAIPELVGSKVLIASLHSDNKIRVWDIEDGRCTSSSSSNLLPNYKFSMLETIQKQFLAVAGENSDIMIVDVWSMERLAYFSMSASVIDIKTGGPNEFWAIDTNGSLRLFYVPTMENYFFETNCVPEISNTAILVYNVKDEVEKFVISACGQLIVVLLKHGIRIYLKLWVVENRNEYSHIESKEVVNVLCSDYLAVILSEKVMISKVSDIVKQLGSNKLKRSQSLITSKLHNLDWVIDMKSLYLDPSFTYALIDSEKIVGFKENSIAHYSLSEKSLKKYVFSFKNINFEHFADMCIHHLISDSETITCYQTFLTSEWPLYIIGTSLGKVFVCPFQPLLSIQCYNFHDSPITCIYIRGERMITCCKKNYMCMWNLETEKRTKNEAEEFKKGDKEIGKRRSSHAVYMRNSLEIKNKQPIQTLLLYFGSIIKIIRVEPLKDEKQIENFNYVLGQSEDSSIILICLTLTQVLSIFPPISGALKESFYHISLDYLYVVSEFNELYTFCLGSNTLERVISGVDLYSFLRKPPRKRISTETFEEVVEETSAKQRITMFNLRQLFPASISAALKVSKIQIGLVEVPLLTINVQQILKKIKSVESPSVQLEYIISLLTCWNQDCKAHASMYESIQDFMKMNVPLIKANIGIIGVDGAMSFTLPNEKSSFEISSYITALIMSAGYAIIDGLSRCNNAKIKKNSRIVTAHLLSSGHSSDTFKVPFLSVLAIQGLSGINTSRFILQDNLTFTDLVTKQKIFETVSVFIEEQWSVWNKVIEKTGKNHVGLMEALCASLLGFAAIELKQGKKEIIPMVIRSLRNMLKSDIAGYIETSANILGKGMFYWKSELKSAELKEIVKELLLYGCKDLRIFESVIKKSLVSIAVCDFLSFIEIISLEIENLDIDPKYPSACIQVLDLFILKKYEEVVAYLPAVIELIVRTMNPHNPMLRKNTIEKVGHTLKTLVLKLPMVDFCQIKQRLAIGTQDNYVIVYDLKTASQWKVLKGHTGPVCSVCFDKTGDFLASYSNVDCTVKTWKIKSGFLQDLIGNNASHSVKNHQLEVLESSKGNFKMFLDTVKINWEEKKIKLIREDGNTYVVY